MARRLSNFRLSFVLLFVPFLTSCLELNALLSFRTSTSGQIVVEAFAHRLGQGMQMVEGSDRLAFPTTRAEWQVVVDQINGFSSTPSLTLASWESVDEDLGQRTKTTLAFSNARALEALFVVFKQKLTLLQANDGRWTLTFVPQVPRVTAADPGARRLWTAVWGDLSWTLVVVPPGQPKSERTVTLAELAGDQPPVEWKVTW